MERFDVLVLGGGAAGCVLASRLSENRDRTVCLVEAGPDYGPYTEGRWPADILDARRLALDSHCWLRNDQDDRSQLRALTTNGRPGWDDALEPEVHYRLRPLECES